MDKGGKLEKYIAAHISPEDEILKSIDRETNQKVLNPRMLSGHLQGQVLSMLSKMVQPANILEIGTFTGYSAICLARGLKPGGKLVTLEADDELENMIRSNFQKAGLSEKIELIIGQALEIIPHLEMPFDLIFIDADKREYLDYYKLLIDKILPGAFIIADNTLWNGKVAEPDCTGDEQTQGIIEFNEFIKNDLRVEKVILPIRDGITLIRKNTVN